MKKTLCAWAAVLAMVGPAHAATGVFGSYLAIDADGPGAAFATWYGAQQPGSKVLASFNGLNLGSFVSGSTATLAGGELLTWKNTGGNITGGVLHWRVDSGAYQDIAIDWTANATFTDRAGNSFSGGGDQRWGSLRSTSVNFLSGVSVGTHTLQVYFTASSNEGNRDSGSAASPYSATFTVTSAVPEPSSAALLLAGAGLLVLRRRLVR